MSEQTTGWVSKNMSDCGVLFSEGVAVLAYRAMRRLTPASLRPPNSLSRDRRQNKFVYPNNGYLAYKGVKTSI